MQRKRVDGSPVSTLRPRQLKFRCSYRFPARREARATDRATLQLTPVALIWNAPLSLLGMNATKPQSRVAAGEAAGHASAATATAMTSGQIRFTRATCTRA